MAVKLRLAEHNSGSGHVRPKGDATFDLLTERWREHWLVLIDEIDRYGYIAGGPARTDDEEQELHELRERLRRADADPGWEPVARDAIASSNGTGSPSPGG